MVFEDAPKAIGLIWAALTVLILAYLFKTGRFSSRIGYVFLAGSAAMGFLIFAPMFPNQIQMLAFGQNKGLGGPVALVGMGLIIFVLLSFVFGRLFCGYACPIGAVQELAYHLPIKKLRIPAKTVFIAFRIAFLAAIIVGAIVFSEGVLSRLGLKEFFHWKTAASAFYVFLGILIASAGMYRPFCRLFCPYGAVLSLVSIGSLHRLRRNENCIECGRCEKACPTREAGASDLKQECYLCDRCRAVCPVEAIEYTRNSAPLVRIRKALGGASQGGYPCPGKKNSFPPA